MNDFIWLSANDPWWITTFLLVARTIAALVMIAWAINMIRQAPPQDRLLTWPWKYSWPLTLTFWLIALILVITINIFRVLLIGHLRAQDMIGQWFRYIEVGVAVYLMSWSILAYIRWRNPKGIRPSETSFSEDTTAKINDTASDVAEVKTDVKEIRDRMDKEGIA